MGSSTPELSRQQKRLSSIVAPTVALPTVARRARSARVEPRISLLQEELRNLPVAEALRQILIERTGSLKFAYRAMDVNGSGVVNPDEFGKGLLKAGIFGSPMVGFRNVSDIFRQIDKPRNGLLSLQEFLGYVPYDNKKHKRDRDTRAQWINYNNKTAAGRSRLARKPKWKADRIAPDEDFHSADHTRAKKELKLQLLDARKRGGLKMEEKRRLVRGLVSDEERDREWQQEYRKMNEQNERIGEAIHSCSNARSELVALQKAMVQLSPEAHLRAKYAHLDLHLNLKGRAHTPEEFPK